MTIPTDNVDEELLARLRHLEGDLAAALSFGFEHDRHLASTHRTGNQGGCNFGHLVEGEANDDQPLACTANQLE
jgi:hypothetical protein